MAKIPTSWKSLERRVAHYFGGQRRGADYGDSRGGKNDIIHPHFSIEVKLLGAPRYQQMVDACKQAEAAAEPHQEPIAVVKRKSARDMDALVCMRLETFLEWRVSLTDTPTPPPRSHDKEADSSCAGHEPEVE